MGGQGQGWSTGGGRTGAGKEHSGVGGWPQGSVSTTRRAGGTGRPWAGGARWRGRPLERGACTVTIFPSYIVISSVFFISWRSLYNVARRCCRERRPGHQRGMKQAAHQFWLGSLRRALPEGPCTWGGGTFTSDRSLGYPRAESGQGSLLSQMFSPGTPPSGKDSVFVQCTPSSSAAFGNRGAWWLGGHQCPARCPGGSKCSCPQGPGSICCPAVAPRGLVWEARWPRWSRAGPS